MCHLVLALPILALPLFWLLPLSAALPVYAAIGALSAAIYAYTWKHMRAPHMNGPEAMLGARATVVSTGEHGATVFLRGELWSADADGEKLAIGDNATIVGIDGLRLRVKKACIDLSQPRLRDGEHAWH